MTDDAFLDHRILTPIHKLKMALRDLPYGLPTPEKMPTHSLKRITATTAKVSQLECGLGSAGTRTATMMTKALRRANDLIASFQPDCPVVFTDGSAKFNPGPCGAGAVCFPEGIKSCPLVIKEAVAPISTSYHGEVYAIKLATEFLKTYSNPPTFTTAHILSDCQSAIKSCTSRDTHKSHQECIDQILDNVKILDDRGISVQLHWVAGHVNLAGNELADRAAKEAAADAESSDLPYITSVSTIYGIIKRAMKTKWQRMWKQGVTGREHYEQQPKIPRAKYTSHGTRTSEVKLLRLKAGHAAVKEQLYRMKLSETPNCECEKDRETLYHLLMKCPLLARKRETMFNEIDYSFMKHNTPIWQREITFDSIVWPTHLEKETAQDITRALLRYLKDIKL